MTISAPTAVVAIDTTKLVNGRHRLSVKVRDAAGALVIINRHFNVANGYRD
jgi:hypothetical protein